MPIFCRQSSNSLFDRVQPLSSVPGKIHTFSWRGYGLGRPLRRRVSIALDSCLPDHDHRARLRIVFIRGGGRRKHTDRLSPCVQPVGVVCCQGIAALRVPAHWIRAVMQLESIGDKGALSPKGAMGLMQIMPETYAELRLRYHLGADPYEPRNNILAGAAYLREMHDRFGPGGFLAAYKRGTRTIRRLSETRPAPSRRGAQRSSPCLRHDRRAWRSASFLRRFNGITIDGVWRHS